MDLHSIPLFKALTRHMTWLNQRQEVLAENVANGSTPGYRPKDLNKPSFDALLGGRASTELEATHAGHMTPSSGATASSQTNTSGDAVVLETELMKIAQTRMDHAITANLYRKHLDMFRMVLARR